jgi:hypothetical protein
LTALSMLIIFLSNTLLFCGGKSAHQARRCRW